MLTKLTIRNFKRFDEVEVELGNPVVFIGPNNSGKTSAMQALALWDIGLKRWNEKHAGKTAPEKRPGVTVNRRDLFSIPHPSANHLWRGLHVRDVRNVGGRTQTSNVRIDLIVEGVINDNGWKCGLEFDFANTESFYCRPLRLDGDKHPERMPVPREAGSVRIAFLPPMSGLAATETRLDQGAVNVRVGEGRTAEALPELKGVALFDRLESEPSDNPYLKHLVWKRREIENYLCSERTLEAYAGNSSEEFQGMPLFASSEADRRRTAMRESISEVSNALQTLSKGSPWSIDIKASDDFLTPLFESYFKKIGIPNLMLKRSFHELANFVPNDEIDPEIGDMLNAIVETAESA